MRKPPRVPPPKSSVKGKLDPTRCEALARNGKQCKNVKGYKTDHVGEGKCRLHGGATPIKTGRYSGIKGRNRMAQLIERFENDENPLDILPELAVARAILTDFVERHGDWAEMIEAWHESYTGKFRAEMNELRRLAKAKDAKGLAVCLARIEEVLAKMPTKPNKLMDILEAVKALKVISDLADKVTAVRERQQIPLSAVLDMQTKMSYVMGTELTREMGATKAKKAIQKIADGWDQIQIETN